tara:strand:- start:1620 stop:2111 length:492 start_codon:yes stop_codon:yes gene_type:complete
MNILHNLITVISMCYTFIFGVVGAYAGYLKHTPGCNEAHGNPNLKLFDKYKILPKLDLIHYLSYFLASLMFLNAVCHLVIFVKKMAIIGFLFILVLFILFVVEIYLIIDLISIIKKMNDELDGEGDSNCKLQIPNDLLNTVLGVSTGLIFFVVLVSFGLVAYG